MASSRSLIAILLLGTLLVCASAGVADVFGSKDSDSAAATAKDSAQSWTEAAKEKLNLVAGETQEKTGEAVGTAKEKSADGAATGKSYLDQAKEKLNLAAGETQAKTGETVGAVKEKSAEGATTAQGTGKSYLELAKEKINAFSKYVSKSSKSASHLFTLGHVY